MNGYICFSTTFMIQHAQQRGTAAAAEETALSFTGLLAIGTLCCCTTMSCVALCIKCLTWMFGPSRTRRRIPLTLAVDESAAPVNDCGQICVAIQIGDDASDHPVNTGRNGVVHSSEMEMHELPRRDMENQQKNAIAIIGDDDGDVKDVVVDGVGAECQGSYDREQSFTGYRRSVDEIDLSTSNPTSQEAGSDEEPEVSGHG